MQNAVLNKFFWKDVLNCLRGAFPLVKVLRMVDSEEKAYMGYIYEEMGRAKEKIRTNFNGAARSYNSLWKIIDDRWDRQLHRPLHAAGLFLNPMLRFAPEFTVDDEIVNGMYACLRRMVDDAEKRKKKLISNLRISKRELENLVVSLLHMHLKLKHQLNGGNFMELDTRNCSGLL